MTVDVRIRMIAMKRIVTENDIVGNCSSCGNDYIWLTERGLRISNDRLAKEVINHFEYGASLNDFHIKDQESINVFQLVDFNLHNTRTAVVLDLYTLVDNVTILNLAINNFTNQLKYECQIRRSKKWNGIMELSKVLDGAVAFTAWNDTTKYGFIKLAFKGDCIDLKTRNKEQCTTEFIDDLDAFIKTHMTLNTPKAMTQSTTSVC